MFSARLQRVWRRRIRRRPLLPLLLAATAAVDLVILSTTSGAPNPYASGFLGGQIGLLGAWITWSPRGMSPRIAIAVVLAVLATAMVDAVSIPQEIEETRPDIAEAYRAINSAVMIASLVATTLGAAAVRLAQRALRGRRVGAPWRMRLGVATLLWVTTTFAGAYVFGLTANWQVLSYAIVLLLIVAEAMLTALVLGVATLPMPRLLRSALMVWAPLGVLLWFHDATDSHSHMPIYYATLTAVIGGWMLALEPQRRKEAAAKRAATPAVETVEQPIDVTA